MFGAVIGAEFLSAMFQHKGAEMLGFVMKFGLAVLVAFVILALLVLIRCSVGPMRQGKAKGKRDY
jgi:glucan phosphoethanolaminetransferase (alkaline phosphatase superfamily)